MLFCIHHFLPILLVIVVKIILVNLQEFSTLTFIYLDKRLNNFYHFMLLFEIKLELQNV